MVEKPFLETSLIAADSVSGVWNPSSHGLVLDFLVQTG